MNDELFETEVDNYDVVINPISLSYTTLPDPDLLKDAIKGAFRVNFSFYRTTVEHEGIKYPPTRVFWVTDLIFCPRRKNQELISKRSLMSEEDMIRTAIGRLVHKAIQENIFANAKFEEKFQKSYQEEYILIGKVDCLLNNTVIDFKTISKPKTPQEPAQYYVDQLQLYMWLTDTQASYLVLINTVNGEIEVFGVMRDEARIEYLLKKGLNLARSLDEYTLPEPEPSYDWLCKGCIVDKCEYWKPPLK